MFYPDETEKHAEQIINNRGAFSRRTVVTQAAAVEQDTVACVTSRCVQKCRLVFMVLMTSETRRVHMKRGPGFSRFIISSREDIQFVIFLCNARSNRFESSGQGRGRGPLLILRYF
jgi:hypothetical protein